MVFIRFYVAFFRKMFQIEQIWFSSLQLVSDRFMSSWVVVDCFVWFRLFYFVRFLQVVFCCKMCQHVLGLLRLFFGCCGFLRMSGVS